MKEEDYEYDLAISLLAEDEPFAADLRQRLLPKVKSIFLYTAAEKELQFRDMMDEFTAVFQRKARVVLVLYREKWGSTRWTGLEEGIIKARQLDQPASEYLMMVRMDKSERRGPKWYSDVHHRVDAEDFKPNELAAIIENELRRRGAEVKLETLEEMSVRLKAEQQRLHDFQQLYHSESGCQLADDEAARLKQGIIAQHKELTARIGAASRFRDQGRHTVAVGIGDVWFRSHWQRHARNSLYQARLLVEVSNGMLMSSFPGDHREHKIYWQQHCVFAMDGSGTYGWAPPETEGIFFRTEDLIDIGFRKVLEKNDEQVRVEHRKQVMR